MNYFSKIVATLSWRRFYFPAMDMPGFVITLLLANEMRVGRTCIVSGSFKSQGMGFYILICSLFLLYSEISSVPDRGRYVSFGSEINRIWSRSTVGMEHESE